MKIALALFAIIILISQLHLAYQFKHAQSIEDDTED